MIDVCWYNVVWQPKPGARCESSWCKVFRSDMNSDSSLANALKRDIAVQTGVPAINIKLIEWEMMGDEMSHEKA